MGVKGQLWVIWGHKGHIKIFTKMYHVSLLYSVSMKLVCIC